MVFFFAALMLFAWQQVWIEYDVFMWLGAVGALGMVGALGSKP